jgi:drug/metabolite transporter (DMT)-like permease
MPQSALHASVARPREDRPRLAVALLLFVFGVFSCMDTIAKVLVGEGYSPLQVTFSRYFFHAVVVLALMLPRYGGAALKANHPGLQTLRSLALLVSTVLNFAAVKYLPLTVTIPILFASPLAVCLLSIPILKEQVGIRRLTGVAIGFAGVLVIAQPWSASFHWAMLLSLGSMLASSAYFVLTRLLAGRDDVPVTQVYASVIPALAMCCVAPFVWVTPTAGWHWVLLVGIGLLGGLSHGVLTMGYRYAEASRLAPLVYSQIIYVTLLSWLVFATLPTMNTIVGTAIIVASGLYIWLRERVRARA